MTPQQFDILSAGLAPKRTEAARAVLFDRVSDASAERSAHGSRTRTVRRDVNILVDALQRAELIVNVRPRVCDIKAQALEDMADSIETAGAPNLLPASVLTHEAIIRAIRTCAKGLTS